MTRFEPMPRPTCHGEEEPAVLSAAAEHERDIPMPALRQKPEPVTGATWWQSLSPADRAAAIRRAE